MATTTDTILIAHSIGASRALARAVTTGVRGIALQELADTAMAAANEASEALKRVEARS